MKNLSFLNAKIEKLLFIPFGLLILFFIFPIITGGRLNIQWIIMPIGALIWLLIELRKSFAGIKLAILMGLFLSVFDWVIENLGAIFGYWVSNHSNFYILAVPLEVSLGALFGGAALSLLITRGNPNFQKIVFVSAIFAAVMTFGEYYANIVGLMQYGNGWWSLHAFLAYLGTWVMLFSLNKYLSRISWLAA